MAIRSICELWELADLEMSVDGTNLILIAVFRHPYDDSSAIYMHKAMIFKPWVRIQTVYNNAVASLVPSLKIASKFIPR